MPIDDDLAQDEKIETDELEGDIDKGRVARGMSLDERERHNLTHVPYQCWCSTCVQSRGRDDPHKTAPAHTCIPVVQCDYAFFRSEDEGGRLQPILIGIVARSGYAYGATASAKGAVGDRTLVKDLIVVLQEAGLTAKLRLRSDGEPAIAAVMRAVALSRGKGTMARC